MRMNIQEMKNNKTLARLSIVLSDLLSVICSIPPSSDDSRTKDTERAGIEVIEIYGKYPKLFQ
jgi:hypothetical protein